MGYLKVKLEGNKSVLVDESADRSNQGFYVMVDNTSILYLTIDEHKGTHERNNQWAKILYTINHSISLDVPMVVIEDEVEKLFQEYLKKRLSTMGNSHLFNVRECRKVFFDSHEIAQQKGVYSEDQLKKAIDMARLREVVPYSNGVVEPRWLDFEIIESIKQEYLELEMEEVFHKGTKTQIGEASFTFVRAQIPVTLEIKTNRVDGQLMAYLKHKNYERNNIKQ